jgi:hypothetical protein
MMNTNKETFFERSSWKVLFVLYLLILVLGLGEFTGGQAGDPAMVESVTGETWVGLKASLPRVANLVDLMARIIGSLWIGLALFGMSFSATGFRKGERWAWYALWTLPIVGTLIFTAFLIAPRIPGSPTPPAFFSAPAMFIISALALLLPVRKFFRR